MVSALSRNCRLSFSSALASSVAISSFSLRSRSSTMRSEALGHVYAVAPRYEVPDAASVGSSPPQAPRRYSPAAHAARGPTPSISSSSSFTRSRMLDSVRMLARISSTMIFSNFLALSLGVSQVPLPRLSREWQM